MYIYVLCITGQIQKHHEQKYKNTIQLGNVLQFKTAVFYVNIY